MACLLLAVSAVLALGDTLPPCSWRGVGGPASCRDEAAGDPVV